jgi:hypothetical protein
LEPTLTHSPHPPSSPALPCSRAGEAVKQLAALRPDLAGPRSKLLSDLASLDPAAAAKVGEIATAAVAAAAGGDADAKARLVGEIAAIDPSDYYADDSERVAAAAAMFDALAAHGKAGGAALAPPGAGARPAASA